MRRFNPISMIRKLVVGAVGSTVIAAGLVMLITPGPGILAILAGLGILATEFAAARRILNKLRRRKEL